MASLFDGLNAKDLSPADLEKLSKMFSAVRGAGALESAFQPNQGPAEQPRLEPMPVGQGSWFNRPYQSPSVQTYLKRQADIENKMEQEQAQVKQFILTHEELAGEDPTAWNLKGIQDFYKGIIRNKPNPLKEQKQKADLEAARLRNEAARNKANPVSPFGAQPAAPGVPAAPGGETKNVGGKIFKRINGAWVQQG